MYFVDKFLIVGRFVDIRLGFHRNAKGKKKNITEYQLYTVTVQTAKSCRVPDIRVQNCHTSVVVFIVFVLKMLTTL